MTIAIIAAVALGVVWFAVVAWASILTSGNNLPPETPIGTGSEPPTPSTYYTPGALVDRIERETRESGDRP